MTNLPKIGKPATNALNKINVTTLEQVAQLDEHNLAKLHGMGPKAIGILKEALLEQGLSFSQLDEDLKNVKFTVLGDLKCDNAPKRRIIRDIVSASLVGDEKYLNEWLTDDLVWKVPGSFELKGRKAFLEEINEHLQKYPALKLNQCLRTVKKLLRTAQSY
ncbi:helix-hairpin-helix domain-containing protein [Mammaliicoccus sciuri]|uniref:DNA-binding protein n=1 Tax=Mammaliicoccus sciuri TaxID=1296 RepID=UPI0021D33C23|nr:DNA-binding protein [Mammaliicoccus sciuri]UXV32660.1 DNA-binding protein [Mammaliicoccus sciuri]